MNVNKRIVLEGELLTAFPGGRDHNCFLDFTYLADLFTAQAGEPLEEFPHRNSTLWGRARITIELLGDDDATG